MTLGRFNRLTQMTFDECAWRARVVARTAADRFACQASRSAMGTRGSRSTRWRRRVMDTEMRGAIARKDWAAVHDSLAHRLRHREPRFALDPAAARGVRDAVLVALAVCRRRRGGTRGSHPRRPLRPPRVSRSDVRTGTIEPSHRRVQCRLAFRSRAPAPRAADVLGRRAVPRPVRRRSQDHLGAESSPALAAARTRIVAHRRPAVRGGNHRAARRAGSPRIRRSSASTGRACWRSASARSRGRGRSSSSWRMSLAEPEGPRRRIRTPPGSSTCSSQSIVSSRTSSRTSRTTSAPTHISRARRWLCMSSVMRCRSLRQALDGVATGRRILLQEIDRQILADGGHAERSTHYQRYTLDFYLLALLTRAARTETPRRFPALPTPRRGSQSSRARWPTITDGYR